MAKKIMFLSLQRVHPNCERCPRSICAGLALRHGPVIPCSVCAVGMSTKENLATSVPSSKNEHSERRAVVHWGVYVVERDRSLQDCSFTAKKPEQGVCVWHQVLACSLPPGVGGLCLRQHWSLSRRKNKQLFPDFFCKKICVKKICKRI